MLYLDFKNLIENMDLSKSLYCKPIFNNSYGIDSILYFPPDKQQKFLRELKFPANFYNFSILILCQMKKDLSLIHKSYDKIIEKLIKVKSQLEKEPQFKETIILFFLITRANCKETISLSNFKNKKTEKILFYIFTDLDKPSLHGLSEKIYD